MDNRARQRSYKEAVEKDAAVTPKTKFSDAFGFSNSAKIIEGGLFAFNANFNQLGTDHDQIVVHCVLRFPPEDEVYFSLFIKSQLPLFRQRLDEMATAGTSKPRKSSRDTDDGSDEEDDPEGNGSDVPVPNSPDGLSYTDNNKNVKGYIAAGDGLLYCRNKAFWNTMPTDLSTISKPVLIDRIVFSIWPPAASARRSLLARQFVGYLGSLIGREKVHELRFWDDSSAASTAMRRNPASVPIADIEASVAALGGYYPAGEIRRYHSALNFLHHKHFVIVTGLSGTGKTQLAVKYARAVHGLKMTEADPFLFICPVRPEWTDPTGLTGYYDVLSNRYIVPPFLEAILLATAHRESPIFVILDEMNLARVEYYFSDILSAIETQEPLSLHSSGVPLEGSTGTSIPAVLPLPTNLYITGTINIDETTNAVSDKVLDRAIVIDMSAVDLIGFLADLETRDPTIKTSRTVCEPHLQSALEIMSTHGLGFGYRVAEEVLRYHAFATGQLHEDPVKAVDDLMVQKVLVKLRGTQRQRPMLQALAGALAPLSRAQAALNKLITDLDEFGSFQASR